MQWTCGINCIVQSQHIKNMKYSNSYTINSESRQTFVSLSGSSPLCVKVISNTKKISGGYVKHNNLLWCKLSKGGLHVSALFYKAIVRSDMVETIQEQLQC